MATSMQARIIQIRTATDELIRRLLRWVNEEKSVKVMPVYVANQIHDTAAILGQAEVPESCQKLNITVSRVAEEYRAYNAREHGKVHPQSGAPGNSFWGAVIALVESRNGIDAPLVERLEPVALLLKQNVTHEQIAKHIYGRGGVGPFLQMNGIPDTALIEQEAANPGSVIGPDWVPPWHADRIAKENAVRAEQIKVFRKMESGSKRYQDPGTVESMLQDGCYVQQIEAGKNVSREEVLRIARQIGVEAVDRPGWRPAMIENSPGELAGDGDLDGIAGPDDNDLGVQSKRSEAAQLKAAVLDIWSRCQGEKGAAEIAAELRQQGFDIVTNRVSAIIGHHKKQTVKDLEQPASTA